MEGAGRSSSQVELVSIGLYFSGIGIKRSQ